LQELRNLNDGGAYFLTEGLNDNALPNCEKVLNYMVNRAKGVNRTKRAPHRPSGVIKQPKLQELVSTLYDFAEKHGGKLALSKGEWGNPIGSLPDAIMVIAPYVPSTNLKIPSYQTLRRMRNVAKEEYCRRR